MAHFAEVDENGNVVRVIVVSDADTADETGTEVESVGAQFCTDLLGGTWVQASYNATIRTRFAGIGSHWDETRDAFIDPAPFPSWILDNESTEWVAPAPHVPGCIWDEATSSWVRPESPFPSWVWSEEKPAGWRPPSPYLGVVGDDGLPVAPFFAWDEATTTWVEAP
jgi:hypothetical protein